MGVIKSGVTGFNLGSYIKRIGDMSESFVFCDGTVSFKDSNIHRVLFFLQPFIEVVSYSQNNEDDSFKKRLITGMFLSFLYVPRNDNSLHKQIIIVLYELISLF